MDIVKKRRRGFPRATIFAVVCFSGAMAWLWLQPKASESIDSEKLITDIVKRGDFDVSVTGFGHLRSRKQTMLTTRDRAIVEEIVLRPGAMIESGSVIVKLKNPEIEQQAADSRVEWQQQISYARQQRLNNTREILAAESVIADVNAEHVLMEQRLEAFNELIKNGVVSVLDHNETKLKEDQLRKKLKIEYKRLTQLKQLHQESENIQAELIEQKKNQYGNVVQRLEALTVRSSSKGILQRLPIELGQSLSSGEQVALVGSVDELDALVRISQHEVTQVVIGQQASIVLDGVEILGEVHRVDPAVQDNGVVIVEVQLNGTLPPSARPERMVDATIITASLTDVFYIKRPILGRKNTHGHLYKIKNTEKLERAELVFGDVSLNYIQIASGGLEGEEFVLSDMSSFEGIEEISIR